MKPNEMFWSCLGCMTLVTGGLVHSLEKSPGLKASNILKMRFFPFDCGVFEISSFIFCFLLIVVRPKPTSTVVVKFAKYIIEQRQQLRDTRKIHNNDIEHPRRSEQQRKM